MPALLIPLMLTSCAGSIDAPAVTLPPVPACLTSPAVVPEPQVGEPLAVIAARERAGRLDNARKLACGVDAWLALQAAIGGTP